MKIGFALPTAGPLASTANIVQIAQAAERLGYDSLWTYERLLRPVGDVVMGGGPPQKLPDMYHTVYEPLETLAYVAALTERITLGTSVVDALFHPPVVLARRFATIDQLSGGRVIAGLGQGWMREEFETANVPMKRMGAGFDEMVAAMRACWAPDPVEYKGRFYQITPSEVNPKPVQARLPILVGAMTPAGIERAGRIADGLNPIAMSAESLISASAQFRQAATVAGRDADALTVVARANVSLSRYAMGEDRPYLGGSPEQAAKDLEQLQGKGIDHVFFANMTATHIDDELELLDRIQAAVAGVVAV
jgi:probable F420-dependent oxidoreductase